MTVFIFSGQRYKIERKTIQRETHDLLQKEGVEETAILNIVFVGMRKMRQLVKTYKKEDGVLPVLSFSYNGTAEEDHLIGEVVICYPQAVLLAVEREKRVDKVITELIEHSINIIVG